MRDRLGLDADQIELQDTRTPRSNEMQSLRGCFETAAVVTFGAVRAKARRQDTRTASSS